MSLDVTAVLHGLNTDRQMLNNLRVIYADTYADADLLNHGVESGCSTTLSKCNYVAVRRCIDGKRNKSDSLDICFVSVQDIGTHSLRTLYGHSRVEFFVNPCPGCGVKGRKCSYNPLTNIFNSYVVKVSDYDVVGIPDLFNTF